MTRRDFLLLALLGFAVVVAVAAFQTAPGYMDADYYYAGSLQLTAGKGFTEPYLWNYLDDPAGLPHPSHAYWMPLASILAAIIPWLFGIASWFAARIPFALAAACLPLLTAALAFSFSSRRSLALTSGLLAVFPGFYLPFLPTTDTFALYMLFGGLFFLVISRQTRDPKYSLLQAFLLGLLAGLMHLSRADGLLWLAVALLAGFFLRPAPTFRAALLSFSLCFFVTLCGYLLIMAPWLARNYSSFGSLLAPGGSKMLWLTSYDQIFSYPAVGLTFTTWVQSGLGDILRARLWAFGLNLANAFAVQGSIFLLPFIVIGLWHLRKEKLIKLAVLTWLLILTAMTLAFPFAGARGGFFHSGAALQTVWWAMAPLGLERVIGWAREHRGWNESKARPVFMSGLVGLAVLFSLLVLFVRLPAWGQELSTYRQVNTFLESEGKLTADIVIVSNPPGFYLASSSPAIAVPDGDPGTIQELARRYSARYLILEAGSTPAGLMPVYEAPMDYPGLKYLGDVEGARVYAVQP